MRIRNYVISDKSMLGAELKWDQESEKWILKLETIKYRYKFTYYEKDEPDELLEEINDRMNGTYDNSTDKDF